jgi:hypothetical protein
MSGPTQRRRRALPRPNRGPYATSSGLKLRSYRDRRSAPGMLYSGQIGALMPRQADLNFSHIGTDAAPQACFYSGQIGALTPRQADLNFGHIGTDAAPQACFYSGQIGALNSRQADFVFAYDDK